MAKRTKHKGVLIQGFVRVAIMDYDENGEPTIIARDEKGRLKDSGWCGPNQMTEIGFSNYINNVIGNSTSTDAKWVQYAAVGSGSTPATNASSLPSEFTAPGRKQVTYALANYTKIRFTCSWSSTNQTSTDNLSVQNAGLFHHSTTNSLMCGKTFTQSTWGSNQALNLTYDLNLSAT